MTHADHVLAILTSKNQIKNQVTNEKLCSIKHEYYIYLNQVMDKD